MDHDILFRLIPTSPQFVGRLRSARSCHPAKDEYTPYLLLSWQILRQRHGPDIPGRPVIRQHLPILSADTVRVLDWLGVEPEADALIEAACCADEYTDLWRGSLGGLLLGVRPGSGKWKGRRFVTIEKIGGIRRNEN